MNDLIKFLKGEPFDNSESPLNKKGIFIVGDFQISNLTGPKEDWDDYYVSFFKGDKRVLNVIGDCQSGYAFVWNPSPKFDKLYFVNSIIETEKKVYERCRPKIRHRTIILNEDSYAKDNMEFPIEENQNTLSALEECRYFPNFMRLMCCNNYSDIGLISVENSWDPKSINSEISFSTSYEPHHGGYVNLGDILIDFFFSTSDFTKEDLIIPKVQPIYRDI